MPRELEPYIGKPDRDPKKEYREKIQKLQELEDELANLKERNTQDKKSLEEKSDLPLEDWAVDMIREQIAKKEIEINKIKKELQIEIRKN